MKENQFILDCSVAMTWCFEDERTDYSEKILDYVTQSFALVPAIWPVEVANALVVAERRKRLSHLQSITFIEFFNLLMIRVDNGLLSKPIMAIQELARETGLSAYDAAYLELAIRCNLPIATLDQALLKAANQAHVKVL